MFQRSPSFGPPRGPVVWPIPPPSVPLKWLAMHVTRGLLGWLVVTASGLAAACSGTSAGQPRQTATPAVPVTIATVIEKEMPVEIGVIGTAEAYSSVAVRAQITRELTSVNFQQGDDVSAGQVLFTLDQRPLEAALHQAEANLERDTAQAANAKAQADRYQDLARRGLATKEQLGTTGATAAALERSEEHTSELQSHSDLVCRLLL